MCSPGLLLRAGPLSWSLGRGWGAGGCPEGRACMLVGGSDEGQTAVSE